MEEMKRGGEEEGVKGPAQQAYGCSWANGFLLAAADSQNARKPSSPDDTFAAFHLGG
jgi:hypothetical protein